MPYTMLILTLLMVWFVFLLVGSVSRGDEHIKISGLVEVVLRKRAKAFLFMVENIVALPLCIYFTWAGYCWIAHRMSQGSLSFIGEYHTYPAWIPNIIVPIGFGIASLFYLERTAKQVRAFLLRRREEQAIESQSGEQGTMTGIDSADNP